MKALACATGLACALVLAGCGDDDGATPVDAGRGDGEGPRDSGPPAPDAARPPGLGTCAMPQMVTGVLGTTMVDFDTTDGVAGMLDFGSECGLAMPTSRPPQVVIAYVVPGTGHVAVEFTLVNAVTSDGFDTVVQVRRGMCSATPSNAVYPESCFDDGADGDARSSGVVDAMGGDTLYFVVTGYGNPPYSMDFVSEGPGRIDFTASANTPPTATAGEVRVYDARTEIEATGGDADGDADGVLVTFLDAAGMPVDLDGSGAADGADDVLVGFDADLSGMTTFTAVATVVDYDRTTTLTERLRTAAATQARLQVIDTGDAVSTPPITVALRALTEVGVAGACDAMRVCSRELSCDATSMMCVADAARVTACGAHMPITLAFPTGAMSTTTLVTGSIAAGAGIFTGSCGGTGPEAIYSVTVPGAAGVPTSPVDILLTTAVTATDVDTDTVLHVRGTCVDPTTEPAGACSDDVDATTIQSTVEVLNATARTYYVFIDLYGGATSAATPFGLQVSYRPVLATGTACDPAGMQNRCAGGDCPGGASPVCP